MDWCKSRQICMQLPFPLGVVSLYLLEVQQSCTSSSSVILAHASLKWLHSFVPSLDRNPLDSDFCRNIIESAKRHKSQPIMKKKPITTEIIKNILDVYSKEDANLKDLRIAALCSLAFAGFFRYDELCNIVPKHIVKTASRVQKPKHLHRSGRFTSSGHVVYYRTTTISPRGSGNESNKTIPKGVR